MKDNFDDNLKKKWEEFHFPVDEDHRKEMIALLDQHKRRRTGLFWWVSGLGGATIIASFILFLNKTESVAPAQPVPQQLTEDKIEAHVQSSSNSYEQNSETSAGITDEIDAENQPVPDVPTVAYSARNSKQSSSQLKNKKGSEKKSNSNSPNNENVNRETDTHNTTLDREVTGSEAVTETQIQFDRIESLTSEFDDLQITQRPQIIESRATDMIINPIDVLDILDLTYSRDVKQVDAVFVKRHPIYLFAETGGGFVPGVASKFNSGWNTQAGAGFAYGLNGKQHVTFTAGYQLQHGGFDFERSSAVFQPAFGARSNFHSLSPDRLHFIYAKLGIHHRIQRHILSLYAGSQYLYGAQGTIVINTVDQFEDVPDNTKYAWLNLDGMNRWLWSGEFQYGYQIAPLVSLHGGVKYNFSPLEAIDPSLEDEGFTWDGKYAAFSPNVTIKYFLYGKK